VKLFLKNSNLCDHNSPTSQTDRQTTCDRNTALCTKVHRAVINKVGGVKKSQSGKNEVFGLLFAKNKISTLFRHELAAQTNTNIKCKPTIQSIY